MIQGGRYERQGGQHFNPNIYDDIKTIADHRHYSGNRGPHAGNGRSDAMGGGHAHAGLMVYQGGGWPTEYDGKVFMNNIHGQRLNMDILEKKGSGYVGHHGADFVNFNDSWSQVLNMRYDQDGSVYIIDWYDKNQCHHNNVEGHDRSNGRIFKLIYNDQKFTRINLAEKKDSELVDLLSNKNAWYARHAQQLLQERAAKVQEALQAKMNSSADPVHRLRALWTLHTTSGVDQKTGLALLSDSNEYVRAWTIQFLAEGNNPPDTVLREFARLAKTDSSPLVRLYLAAALQRTPPEKRWDTLAGLVAHGEDTTDQNLPLMYWYAAEASVGKDSAKAVTLLGQAKIPRVREFIARRMATGSKLTAAK
jgi:hypothetical protein